MTWARNLPRLRRRCRSCNDVDVVDPVLDRCPSCGAPFGPITFGLDHDPDEERERLKRHREAEDAKWRAMTKTPPSPEPSQ